MTRRLLSVLLSVFLAASLPVFLSAFPSTRV